MIYHDQQYLNLLKFILTHGVSKTDRTGTGTKSIFGHQMRFNLGDGTIPLLTTKKMHIPAIIHEIIWYLSGSSNIKYLQDNNIKIWNSWADETGELGKGMYGSSWRKWEAIEWDDQNNTYSKRYIDQLQIVIDKLKTNPDDRRLLITAWNPATLPEDGKTFSQNVANGKQALPACHYTFQFSSQEADIYSRIQWFTFTYGNNDLTTDLQNSHLDRVISCLDSHNIPKRTLSCMLTQRSADCPIGVPFNIVQYSIITRMICDVVDMIPSEFIWCGGDVHIYDNQITQIQEQLNRSPYPSPILTFNGKRNHIDDFKYEDFIINNYQHHPALKIPVAV